MNDCENHQIEKKLEIDSETDELHRNVNPIGEGFRPSLITNCRDFSEITVEVYDKFRNR